MSDNRNIAIAWRSAGVLRRDIEFGFELVGFSGTARAQSASGVLLGAFDRQPVQMLCFDRKFGERGHTAKRCISRSPWGGRE